MQVSRLVAEKENLTYLTEAYEIAIDISTDKRLVTFDAMFTCVARDLDPEDLFSEQLLTPAGKVKYLGELLDTLVLVFGPKLPHDWSLRTF